MKMLLVAQSLAIVVLAVAVIMLSSWCGILSDAVVELRKDAAHFRLMDASTTRVLIEGDRRLHKLEKDK